MSVVEEEFFRGHFGGCVWVRITWEWIFFPFSLALGSIIIAVGAVAVVVFVVIVQCILLNLEES